MELEELIARLKNYSGQDLDLNTLFMKLNEKIERNPYVLTHRIKDLIDLLDNMDLQLHIFDIFEHLSSSTPEIFEGAINHLLSSLKKEEIQLDILSVIENILEKDPNILLDSVDFLRTAVKDPNYANIKNDLEAIKKELEHKFPDLIIDPVKSLIKEIENKDINIINIYENIMNNYPEVIEKDITQSIDNPNNLLLLFSERIPEVFKESINYLINALGNEHLQLYIIDILKHIAKKQPVFFEGYIDQLINFLDDEVLQIDIIEILAFLSEIPRLFQSEIDFLIQKLSISVIKADIMKILRDISEINPQFFKSTVEKIIPYLNEPDIAFKINAWGLIRNISEDDPEILKPILDKIIEFLENTNTRLESIEVLRILGRKVPEIFEHKIDLIIEKITIPEIENDILDILLNISIRNPQSLYNHDLNLFKLIERVKNKDSLIEILRNIIKTLPKNLFIRIPNYLVYLKSERTIQEIYPEIKKFLTIQPVIIEENLQQFIDYIKHTYFLIDFRKNFEILKSSYNQFIDIKNELDIIDGLFRNFEIIIKNLQPNMIKNAISFITLIDFILMLQGFSFIVNQYSSKDYITGDQEKRNMFHGLLKTFQNGLKKMYNKISKGFKL